MSYSMFFTAAAALLLMAAPMLLAQGQLPACEAVAVGSRMEQPNIFSEEQEMWLGQIEADLVEAYISPVRDPALGAYLQAIADRLAKTLPPTKIDFRVTLINSDEINGFSIAGGHIYLSRKLAALAHNDDELAGVIAHEIGHIASHQFTFETTREMKRLLNVTSFADEADLRKKYSAMLDAEYRDKHPQLGETDNDQAQADQLGLNAMVAAGYRPESYAGFWNRVFFVEGKTGSRIGDLLGFTKPSQKRLRSISAMVAALPRGCGRSLAENEQAFTQWRDAVVANQAVATITHSGALSEVVLTPPLHLALTQLRFSPDGASILAQDQSSVFVLNREPLSLRFRIEANEAMPATFSPDSQSVSFSTPGLHVEQWGLKDKRLLAAHEILWRNPCYDTRLSPDGRTLLCVQFDVNGGELGLVLLDTASSDLIWEKKSWIEPNLQLAINLFEAHDSRSTVPFFVSSYSADGNVLLFAGGDQKLAFDLRQRAPLKTGGPIRTSITGDYAFVGNDKVAGINGSDRVHSAVYSFPDGRVLEKVSMPFSGVRAVSNPGAATRVVATGLKDDNIGVVDLFSAKFLLSIKGQALDEFGDQVVAEARGGAVVLAHLESVNSKEQQHLDLPLSPLPAYSVIAISPDGKYLALSTARLGALWELTTGKRIGLITGFTDAAWTDKDVLYVDVPKEGSVERHLAEISTTESSLKRLPYVVNDHTHMRYGRLTDWKMDEKGKTWTLSMYEPSTNKVLWSRVFPEKQFAYTASYGQRDLIFNFPLDSHTCKDLLKANPTLAAQAQGIKDKKAGRLIQVLDGNSGVEKGSLVVELSPNFAGTDGLNRAGDLLYVAGRDGRTAVYSFTAGIQVRSLIGEVRAVDPDTGRVFTANRIGEGVVYDAFGAELGHYHFGDPIRYALFRNDAKLITILTADQKIRTMRID